MNYSHSVAPADRRERGNRAGSGLRLLPVLVVASWAPWVYLGVWLVNNL